MNHHIQGLPLVILINDKEEIRWSTADETMATLDDKSFMESYEENKRDDVNNELNNIINNIDSKIAELKQEQSNTSSPITDNTVHKIDTNYQDKIDENRKFSIIDKSVEELITAKNKCINDWLELLSTEFAELWVMNSSFYRTKIDSILNAIIRRLKKIKICNFN